MTATDLFTNGQAFIVIYYNYIYILFIITLV